MKNLHEKAMKEDKNEITPIISFCNRSKADLPPVDLLPLQEQGDDKPLAVIQYNYFKLLGRWLFFYGPGTGVFLLPFTRPSVGWIWLTISSVLVFGVFLLCLFHPINMKSISVYSDYIKQNYRIFGKDRIVDISKADYSRSGIWLRETTVISDSIKEHRKKGIIFFDGLITKASMKRFYLALGEITGRQPEEFLYMCAKLMK